MNPAAVYIQTHTQCNSNCSICPHPKAYSEFGKQRMDSTLFYEIMCDLSSCNYGGVIGLFLQMEPLMDDRIFSFVRLAKEYCPFAIIEISTNGILLEDNMDELKASPADNIYLNYGSIKYGSTPAKVIDMVNELAKHKYVIINNPMMEEDNISHLFPGCRVDNFWVSNRGGNLDNIKHGQETRFAKRECRQLNIVASGDVILCCNDYMREYVFGNAKDENIIKIWNEIPKHFDYPICQKCI
jgi:hypothetical protein